MKKSVSTTTFELQLLKLTVIISIHHTDMKNRKLKKYFYVFLIYTLSVLVTIAIHSVFFISLIQYFYYCKYRIQQQIELLSVFII